MSSILLFNEMLLEQFTPSKNATVAGGKRNGAGVQILRSGISIRGFWSDNVLTGDVVIKFPEQQTEIRGVVDENKLVQGAIRYDSGARADVNFEFDGKTDVFRKVVFYFTNKYYFKGTFSPKGELKTGFMHNDKCLEIGRFKGDTLRFETEHKTSTSPARGIIID